MLLYFNNYMTVLYQYALFIVALFFLDSIFFNTAYACLPVLHHSALHCSSWVWKSRTRQTMPLGNFNVQTRELRFSQWNRSNGLVWGKHAWSWPVAYPWTDAERYRRGLVCYRTLSFPLVLSGNRPVSHLPSWLPGAILKGPMQTFLSQYQIISG